jgi:hypothetical protein
MGEGVPAAFGSPGVNKRVAAAERYLRPHESRHRRFGVDLRSDRPRPPTTGRRALIAREPSNSWMARCRTSRASCSVWPGLDQMASAPKAAAMAESISSTIRKAKWQHTPSSRRGRRGAVEIRHPDGVQITGGFKTEAEAQAYITERQAEDAKRGKKRTKAGRCD